MTWVWSVIVFHSGHIKTCSLVEAASEEEAKTLGLIGLGRPYAYGRIRIDRVSVKRVGGS